MCIMYVCQQHYDTLTTMCARVLVLVLATTVRVLPVFSDDCFEFGLVAVEAVLACHQTRRSVVMVTGRY